LATLGVQVEIYSLQGQPDWFQLRVPVHKFPNYEILGHALREQRAVKIATYWATAPIVAGNSLKGEGFYLVQDIESWFYENDYQKQREVLNTYQLPLNLICESLWVRDQLAQLGRTSKYIGMGIDHDVFRPIPVQSRRPHQVLVNAPRNGILRHLKGIDILEDALYIVASMYPQLELVSFSSSVQPLEIPGVQITHLTRPSDQTIASLYNSATCFALASRHEGFCLPVLEAMSCGCVVVTSRADGNEEFCLQNKTCILVEPEDPQALAQGIISVLSNEAIAKRLREEGLSISQFYEWENPIRQLKTAIEAGFENYES
jgi:glycosyltransferase involved in cell wall biosynthesis